MTQLFEHYLTA